MRLRGKDCVKTLMSTIKKSPNSTRSEIAAAIKFASRHANFRTKLADTLAGEDCDSDDDSDGGGDLGVPVIGDSDDGEAGGGDRGRGSKKARTEDPGNTPPYTGGPTGGTSEPAVKPPVRPAVEPPVLGTAGKPAVVEKKVDFGSSRSTHN